MLQELFEHKRNKLDDVGGEHGIRSESLSRHISGLGVEEYPRHCRSQRRGTLGEKRRNHSGQYIAAAPVSYTHLDVYKRQIFR